VLQERDEDIIISDVMLLLFRCDILCFVRIVFWLLIFACGHCVDVCAHCNITHIRLLYNASTVQLIGNYDFV